MKLPRGRWWDALFVLIAAGLIWLVFGSGRALLDLEFGF